MPETGPVARMAEVLAGRLFSVFKWTSFGPINQNWNCKRPDEHGVKTHPTDLVFYYDEPYSSKRSFFQFDLKSYAKASIKAGEIRNALHSLANQVTCANVSERWQEMYTDGASNFQVHGVLFVYNHDGNYDSNFADLLKKIKLDAIQIPKSSRLYIIGPDDVFWLNNVALDITLMRGSGRYPSERNSSFYYP